MTTFLPTDAALVAGDVFVSAAIPVDVVSATTAVVSAVDALPLQPLSNTENASRHAKVDLRRIITSGNKMVALAQL